jgi:ABC-type dipeptide/oligopeptide/nickel transport system permease component
VRTFAPKLLRLVIVIVAVTFFSFALIKQVPGDPESPARGRRWAFRPKRCARIVWRVGRPAGARAWGL